MTDEPWDPAVAARRPPGDVTVALAAGKAFSFGYAEHGELLRAAGADVVEFDPLTDPLPPQTAAPGAARRIPRAVQHRTVGQRRCASTDHDAARPVARRCTPNARASPIWSTSSTGIRCAVCCAGSARFTDRLTLGYRDAVAVADSPLHTIGDRAVGHEFHRTTVTFTDSYHTRVGVSRP